MISRITNLVREPSSRSKISQFIYVCLLTSSRLFLFAISRAMLVPFCLALDEICYKRKREREREREREKGKRRERKWKKERKRKIFFSKRQFTVKLLGEAWRILRGVQQVVGCNKLLPTTSGSFQASSYLYSLFVRLSSCFYIWRWIRDACILRFRIQHIPYPFRDTLIETRWEHMTSQSGDSLVEILFYNYW